MSSSGGYPQDGKGTLVECNSTASQGKPFVIEVKEEWSPHGSKRFLKLVQSGYFTDVSFYRVVPGFLTQFGITPNRDLRKYWRGEGTIPDDPLHNQTFKRGQLSFAGSGPNSRDFQLFIAYEDSTFLGKSPWEVPIGRVVEGMDVIDSLYAGYGDITPFGKGPDQQKVWAEGNEYLKREYPLLDYFKTCHVLPPRAKVNNPKLRRLGDGLKGEVGLPVRQPLGPLAIGSIIGVILLSLFAMYKISDKRTDTKAHV